MAKAYALTYTLDHARLVHVTILYIALLQTAHICFKWHDYGVVCASIGVSLLPNHCPADFTTKRSDKFFE